MSQPIDNLDSHARWLRTVISARSGADGDAVNDLFQEVALVAIRQKAPLVDVAKIGPWLYQIAVRQALQYRRQLGRRKRRETLVATERQWRADQQADRTSPLHGLLLLERQSWVQQALLKLLPKEREILLLKYSEDWSYQQLAQHLGITTAAVESRLYRARQKLRGELERFTTEVSP